MMGYLKHCILEMYNDHLKSDLSAIMTDENILANDFAVYQNPFGVVERAKAQCNTQLQRVWIKQEIENCGKLGAWKRRMTELLRNDSRSDLGPRARVCSPWTPKDGS